MAETPKQAAERAKALQAIEASEKRIAALVQTATRASAAKLKNIELEIKAEETKQSLQEREISRLGTIKSMYDDIAGGLQSSVTLIKGAAKAQQNMFKATVSVKDIEDEIVKNAKLLNNAKLDGRKSEVKALKLAQQKLKVDRAALKGIEHLADGAASLNTELQDSVKGITDFVGKLPGGGMMTKALGLDKLGEGVEKGLTSAVTAFSATGSLGAGVSAFSKSLLMALGPVALIAAAVIGLVMIFKDVSHKAHELSTNTGLTYAQTKNLVKESNKVVGSFDNQLSLQEDILAVVTETVNEFGVMGMMTTAQAGAISDIGIAFGYGAKQAGLVNNAFMRMGATADEAADTQRDLAAEALKAGVSVGAVTADIAANSKLTSKYFGGNVKALKKAAIEAAKMGVSLESMVKVSDSLLNFEDSISAQFELQALTGKNMNLDGARRLALEGNIAGATAAVLDQVGSIAEFDKLGYLGRKKLAEATGMDVDELQKSMIIKEKMGNLDADQLAAMNGLGLSAAEMTNMSAEDLQHKLASKQASEKMAANFAALKATFVNALMPAAEGLMSIFSALSPLFKVLGGVLKVAFMPITYAAKGFQTIFDLITASLPAIATFLGVMTLITIQQGKGLLYTQGKAVIDAVMLNYGKVAIALETAKNNLQKKTLMKSMGDAAMSAWSSLAKVPVVGAVLGAVAAAGVIAMGMKYMNDGVISGSTGSSGYGSRTMFGPEGAISFNNKDTIVAGTDLFGKANDAMFAPKGAIKMNDGAIGADMPDPPEVKMVGIANQSVAKLSIGIAAAMGLAVAPAFISALALSMPVIALTITSAVAAGMALSMPFIGAAIIGGITAGALATALIPRPVLILNPVLPTFETNPVMMMGSMLGGIGNLLGGGKSKDDKEDAVTMKDVVTAISNITIEMDGQKVGATIRLADTFRRG